MKNESVNQRRKSMASILLTVVHELLSTTDKKDWGNDALDMAISLLKQPDEEEEDN